MLGLPSGLYRKGLNEPRPGGGGAKPAINKQFRHGNYRTIGGRRGIKPERTKILFPLLNTTVGKSSWHQLSHI